MSMLEFESDRFRPFLPDDCQVNPNVLGYELADWLARELAARGYVTSYPVSEDWGWLLEREEDGGEHMICCSGADEGEGRFEWRVYVAQPKKLFGKRPGGAAAEQILQRIRQALEETGIKVTVEED